MPDRVTVGVTHQIDINGERAWIKLEYNTEVIPEEGFEGASERANQAIQGKIINIIESSAQTVIDYENRTK